MLCNLCAGIINKNTNVCSECGVAFTGQLNILQLEEIIKCGNPEDRYVVSAMVNAAKAYNMGSKGAAPNKEKAHIYAKTAAENKGGEALMMSGMLDIDKAIDGEDGDEFSREEALLMIIGLRKLACAHHLGFYPASILLTNLIDNDKWGVGSIMEEMMNKDDPSLWYWEK